jgi:hypothetical protein
MSTLAAQPWWTPADQAELDLLVFEFVHAAFRHREACSVCLTGGPWCLPLRDAWDGLIGWRDGRVLRSKAGWLRAREDEVVPMRGGLF